MKNCKTFEELKTFVNNDTLINIANQNEVLGFIQTQYQRYSKLRIENIPDEKLTQFFESVKRIAIVISNYSSDELNIYKKLVAFQKTLYPQYVFSENQIYSFVEWLYKDKNFCFFQNEENSIDDNIDEFCLLIEKYRSCTLAKQTVNALTKTRPKIDKKNASTQDLINRTTEKLKKVKLDLKRKGITEKSKQLLILIDDFFDNPNDYFPPTLNIKANNEEIRKFFNFLQMPPQAQKELIDNFNLYQ